MAIPQITFVYPELLYKVLVEVKESDESDQRKQRLDILGRDGDSLPEYGFELVVAASETSFDDHCKRGEHYGETPSLPD
ncbi:hypothetical protein BGZ76_006130 [Entomortierella beljakovae]|nr:hypothetical protein BGZ76_006130 [Entomortierella beljakovae]